jgi:hypothetical protein
MKKAILNNVGNEITFQFVYGIGRMGKIYNGKIIRYDPQKGELRLRWECDGKDIYQDWDEEYLTHVKKKGKPTPAPAPTPKRKRGRPRKAKATDFADFANATVVEETSVNLAELAKSQLDSRPYRTLFEIPKPTTKDITDMGKHLYGWEYRYGNKGYSHVELREYPPVKRNVTVCGRNYFLQFPYMVFLQTPFYNLSVGFAKEPITSTKSKIFYPCLPNIFDGYRVCLATRKYNNLDTSIRAFWSNEFRSYHYSGNEFIIKETFGRLKVWEKADLKEVYKKINRPTTIEWLLECAYIQPPKKKEFAQAG